MKIMLLEDDYALNKAIKNYFSTKDIKIDTFLDGNEAFESLKNLYDVCILDIDVPIINGIDLLEIIKDKYPNTHVIMISATINIDTIEKAYKKGCDDYIKKPFSIKELELKLQLLNKNHNDFFDITPEIKYNTNTKEIVLKNESIKLTPKEIKLLDLLLKNRGIVISNDIILDTIWDNISDIGYPRKLVSRLNKKLQCKLVENRNSFGYVIE